LLAICTHMTFAAEHIRMWERRVNPSRASSNPIVVGARCPLVFVVMGHPGGALAGLGAHDRGTPEELAGAAVGASLVAFLMRPAWPRLIEHRSRRHSAQRRVLRGALPRAASFVKICAQASRVK